jgi:hypothetical protein
MLNGNETQWSSIALSNPALSGFEVTVSLSDGSGTQIVLAKKLILAPGAYVNLNSWIRVSHSSIWKVFLLRIKQIYI